MIKCDVLDKATGRNLGRLVAWGPDAAGGIEPLIVAMDAAGRISTRGIFQTQTVASSEDQELARLRAEVATLRARNVELSDQLAQHASDRPRWPKWDELPEEDRGAAKELLGEALGPCNWFEVGRYKTPVGDAYPDHDAVLDRTEDSAPELQRILTEFLRGLAEWETEQ